MERLQFESLDQMADSTAAALAQGAAAYAFNLFRDGQFRGLAGFEQLSQTEQVLRGIQGSARRRQNHAPDESSGGGETNYSPEAQKKEMKGGTNMGDKGKRDKGKREQQKKALMDPKEKRKLKKEKKNK